MKFLEGAVGHVDGAVVHAAELDEARARIIELEDDKSELQQEIRELKRQLAGATAVVNPLRRTLTPLYKALQQVFGELEAIDGGDEPQSVAPKTSAIWNSWKQKLSPACGKIIDVLLEHGQMSAAQLKVAARLGTSTVSESVGKMRGLGLLEKSNGIYSLKKLS